MELALVVQVHSMIQRHSIVWALLVSILSSALTTRPLAASPPWMATGRNGMVATDSPEASRVGAGILKAGGNAIDAAVAISFALAVTRPQSTGLGGGGFMIARFADGRVVVQDFRESAPAAATRDMYVRAKASNPKMKSPSRFGHLAVAVPGLVAGRCQALAQYGTLPLARVIAPAIDLARHGFGIDAHYVESAAGALQAYERNPALKNSCSYVYATHLGNGALPMARDRLTQPKLARLLEGIASGGADFFYRGPVAQAIATEMKKHGGIITAEDLAAYKVKEREAVRSIYGDFDIIGMPPPSSGGIALVQTFNVLELVNFRSIARRDPGLAAHYQIEAMKHAFADRARWLADADFADVPVSLLTSQAYATQLAMTLRPNDQANVKDYGIAQLPDDAGTSHVCVVDRWGNVVVTTETINTSFGSLAAVDEWGLILNNEMDDFVSEPGKPNAYGLIQSPGNAIEPGKRPLSSMAPTIVLKKGKPFLMLGASGGPRIISSLLNVMLSVMDFDMSLEEAMTRIRPHHQWKPDAVMFDVKPDKDLEASLIKRGHALSEKRKTGIVQAIMRIEGGWRGASDPRKGGRPAGY